MKPVALCVLVLASVLAASGCGKKAQAPAEDVFSGEVGGEITVSAYDTLNYRSFLEEAARAFEAQYPGTKINVETFSAMPEIRTGQTGDGEMVMVQVQNDPQGRADYISRVNTGLMSGEGADVLAMDVLPLHKFVESGQLENLEALMNRDPAFNKTDYRENILDALRYRGGIWLMPLNYSFNYFAYDATLIPEPAGLFGLDKAFSAGDLFNIGKNYFDGSIKLFNTTDYNQGPRGGMFDQLLEENLSSFVDLQNHKVNFADGVFTSLLESVKAYGEQGYIPRGVTGQVNAGQMRRQSAEAITERFFFKLNDSFFLVSQFTSGTGIRILSEGGSGSIEDDDEIAGIAANADGKVPFTYSMGYGINSQSKNKALSWAFIKFLLSEEMQLSTTSAPSISSLPINNKAREQKAELVFSGAFMGMGTGQPLNASQQAALNNYNAAMEALSDQINTYTIQDTTVNDMISAEVQYFFSGSRTAGEVASVLQNKTDLYLNE
jgi:ABC-type glycerol-3-phosphate transport system substrate-binding protein